MDLPAACRRVYLIRHAESARIGEPFPMDPALTERGEAQIEALRACAMSMPIDAIVCSELVRARRTADVIGAPHGIVPTIDPEWNEFHTVGAWREHGSKEVDELVRARFYRPDDRRAIGESLRALYRRTAAAWERLLALPGRNLVLVSHNGVIGTLVQMILGLREDDERSSMISYPHAAISEMWILDRDYDADLPGRITVAMRIADVGHLSPEIVTR